jgi:gamma-glutamylcyclotransferase (GGCT)/AIG2-like uncharacterized protein YtfP
MKIFIYGTLINKERFRSVTGIDQPELTPAFLHNYKCRTVMGGAYPGIVPSMDIAVTEGYVLDIPGEGNVLANLDRYEGEGHLYTRTKVAVHLADEEGRLNEEEAIEASTYVFMFPERLTEDRWDIRKGA